jgi:hypothetical protein
MNFKVEKLEKGESFITSEKGNSMVPLIKSGQKHKLEPATWENVEVGDIVYCKVKGNFYTHLVKAKNEKSHGAFGITEAQSECPWRVARLSAASN